MRFLSILLAAAIALPAYGAFWHWPGQVGRACWRALAGTTEAPTTVPRPPSQAERDLMFAAMHESPATAGAMFRPDPTGTAAGVRTLANEADVSYMTLLAFARSVEGALHEPGAAQGPLRDARDALLARRRALVAHYEQGLRGNGRNVPVLNVARLVQVVRHDPEFRLEAARALGRLAKESRNPELLQDLRPQLRALLDFVAVAFAKEGLSPQERGELESTALVLTAATHHTFAAEADAFRTTMVQAARASDPAFGERVRTALSRVSPLSTLEAQAFLDTEARMARRRGLVADGPLQDALFGIDSLEPARNEGALTLVALRLAYVRVLARFGEGTAQQAARGQLRFYDRQLEILRDEAADRARVTGPVEPTADPHRTSRQTAQRLVVENDVDGLRELLERLERGQANFDVRSLDSPEGVTLIEVARRARSGAVLQWLEARGGPRRP